MSKENITNLDLESFTFEQIDSLFLSLESKKS